MELFFDVKTSLPRLTSLPRFTSLPRVLKRDNVTEVDFDANRIENAIEKAFDAVSEFKGIDNAYIKDIAEEVISAICKRGLSVIAVEQIQDIVEDTIIAHGFSKVARAYIVYRREREKIRESEAGLVNLENTTIDIDKLVKNYISQEDWRTFENSNSSFSYPGLYLHVAGSVIANYTLKNVYPEHIRKAHESADIHIHDLSHGIVAYCAGWSMEDLLRKGFRGGYGQIVAGPAKHLSALTGQMVNFLGVMQMEFAGAQAFNSVDTFLAPFVRVDNLDYQDVKQLIQQMVFAMNVPSRWGSQPPFINFTFDWTVPEDMKNKPVIIGGEERPDIGYYGDFQKEMDVINKAFIEVMLEGDYAGRIFSFPIPTYNITKDFDFYNENARLLWKMTAKYGTPYFQNFVSSSLKPGDVRSMCCRLQLDLRELRSRMGGLFGAADKTGSIGVVTINLPRIGYLAKTKEEYFSMLFEMMDIAKESLEIKRRVVERNLKAGLMPYAASYLNSFDNHFSTIGIVGMHESLLNFLGKGINTKEGKTFAIEVLQKMRERLSLYQELTGHLYNLEATPAEGTSYRLAKHDKKRFPNIITSGENEPYYTNSTLLPVGYTDDPFEVLEHQKDLQTLYTGGTVVHMFLGESPNEDTLPEFIKKAFETYPIPYLTITPTFSVCPNHGYLKGEYFNCPICNAPSEVYSRVVGYYRPVQRWNAGKKEEFKDRLEYVL